jgi:hypothetical protein
VADIDQERSDSHVIPSGGEADQRNLPMRSAVLQGIFGMVDLCCGRRFLHSLTLAAE